MTTINLVFPSRKWAIRAGEPKWYEKKELPFDEPTAAHEVVRFRDRHTGWYTREDPSKDDLLVGFIFRVRTPRTYFHGKEETYRHGWLAGYQETCNDGYLIETDTVFADKQDAARAADHLAEVAAEKERDYQEAWHQGDVARQLADDANEIRDKVLEHLTLMNKQRRLTREVVADLLDKMHAFRRRRDKLRDDCPSSLMNVFNEGYGS